MKNKSTEKTQRLSPNWLTEGWIDFELKKYQVLAYLKAVQENFSDQKLYPYLGDLVVHYNNLIRLRNNKKLLQEEFPEELDRIDLEKLKLSYRKIMQDDELMQQINQIVNYALPAFQQNIENGANIYNWVENQLHFDQVGILPLHKEEGYFFLSLTPHTDLLVFYYRIRFFEKANDRFQGIHTRFISREKRSISRTLEHIKRDLIRSFIDLPNPATFWISSEHDLPLKPTLLPIAERYLVRKIANL